jgi:predicted PurR-regulated permease PerM
MKAIRVERYNSILAALVLTGLVLYFAKDILMLLVFAMLLAMLLNPVAEKLEKKGMKRVWSTILCLLLVLLAFAAIITLVSAEIGQISEKSAQIRQKGEQLLKEVQTYVQQRFDIPPEEQDRMMKEQSKNLSETAKTVGQGLVVGTAGILVSFVMVLVFMFLFLLQKEKYKTFLLKLCSSQDKAELEKLVSRISTVSQKYLLGMIYSILIMTTLYSIGFLIVGLENAILLAFIASVLIIIPYIGAWVGGLIPVTVALVTGDSSTALAVAGVMIVVQTLDNNFIEPYVVGGEVRLSAAATVLALLAGSAIWGIPGVVLFIPLTGILKIVFDHVEPLKPYGYLIGDTKEAPSKSMMKWIKGIFGKGK